MPCKFLTLIFTLLLSVCGWSKTPLDSFSQKAQLLKSQQSHLKKGEYDKYFGKRAFVMALAFSLESKEENDKLDRLAIELGLLDIIAFSKICDFSMGSQSINQLRQMDLTPNDLKGLSLTEEYFELRKKLYPKAAKKSERESKKVRIHWKVPHNYLAKVTNLDLLRVKVEDKCE